MGANPKDTGLLNRFDLIARPADRFAMFSSEAAAARGGELLRAHALGRAYVPTTWPLDPGAWQYVDISPLIGREGLLIADNTPDDIEQMHRMAGRLLDLGCSLRWADTSSMPIDWTVPDFEGDPDDFIAWARDRTAAYTAPNPAPQATPAPSSPSPGRDSPPEPAGAGPSEMPQDEPIPLEAYAGEGGRRVAPEPQARPPRQKPRLHAVNGNTALAPDPDAEPVPQSMSEDALADHFATRYGENWRFVKEWGQWLEWDGDRWFEDRTSKVERLALEVTREALTWDEAKTLTPKERRAINKKSTAWAIRDIAGTFRRCAATVDQWDRDPLLLGVPGGVVDLRDGSMLEASREQYISKRCAVAPANGEPKLWTKYLQRAHGGDGDIIAYLQRYAGYCATGLTTEHALAFLYGTGRNGKGVFLETISGILGEYARTAAMDTFMEQKHAAHSTELARLHGARLVITEEAASGGRWNEARIKHITGGGKITAHFMRQDDFEFTPAFKLLIAANHKPMLRAVDEAIKARIHLVPFKVTIPAEERDPHLLAKLREEWPQILGWILDGCAEWQRAGLRPPQAVLDATQQYVESQDVLGQWIEECCERDDVRMVGGDGYRNYCAWSEKQGERVISRRSWSDSLIERGFESCKDSSGTRCFAGLSLKPFIPA